MRFLCFLFLVVILLAVGGFAVQNLQPLTLTFWPDRTETFPVAGVLGTVYVLGMLTGWTVVGLLRRTFERATDFRDQRAAAR
jgi:hypothetical protein